LEEGIDIKKREEMTDNVAGNVNLHQHGESRENKGDRDVHDTMNSPKYPMRRVPAQIIKDVSKSTKKILGIKASSDTCNDSSYPINIFNKNENTTSTSTSSSHCSSPVFMSESSGLTSSSNSVEVSRNEKEIVNGRMAREKVDGSQEGRKQDKGILVSKEEKQLHRGSGCSSSSSRISRISNEGAVDPELQTKTAYLVRRSGQVGPVVQTPQVVYRYKHIAGNNGRIILLNFRKRPWWHSGKENKKSGGMPLKGDTGVSTKVKGNTKGVINEREGITPKEVINYNFVWEMCRNPKRYASNDHVSVVLNHIENNRYLVSKKHLYFCIRDYCAKMSKDPLDYIPRTFYLAPMGGDDSRGELNEFQNFNMQYLADAAANGSEDNVEDDNGKGCIWILKPASYANRGFGIKVVRGLEEALQVSHQIKIIKEKERSLGSSGSTRSDSSDQSSVVDVTDPTNLKKRANNIGRSNGWISQEYMKNPLLISGRKFDIRCYVLVTNSRKDGFKAYWFRDGYIRTSCKKYSLSKLSDRETHLTNDAVQKHSKAYGKFESGNKLTYGEWQESIKKDYPNAPADVVFSKIVPQIKEVHIFFLY